MSEKADRKRGKTERKRKRGGVGSCEQKKESVDERNSKRKNRMRKREGKNIKKERKVKERGKVRERGS